jgi:hypothetical protein
VDDSQQHFWKSPPPSPHFKQIHHSQRPTTIQQSIAMSSSSVGSLLLFVILILAAPLLSVSAEEERFDRYAGYVTTTLVTDEAVIDLDQMVINDLLSDRKIKEAMSIYREGGHSGSYAVLSLKGNFSGQPLLAGTSVIGNSTRNNTVVGTLKENVTIGAKSDNVIEVTYPVVKGQKKSAWCQVGALTGVQLAKRDGCKLVRLRSRESASL